MPHASGTQPLSFLRAALAGVVGLAGVGCANIWGFEDPIPRRDAGAAGADPGACVCAAAAPAGWQGPFEFFEADGGPPIADPPPCAGAYPATAFVGFASPAPTRASCSCACGAPSVTCSTPIATLFSDDKCSKPCGTVTVGATCAALDAVACGGGGGPGNNPGGASVSFARPVGAPGACTPQATADAGAAPWTQSARLCGPASASAGSCAGGSVCAPPTDVGFESDTYCVVRAGMSPCPTGMYTAPRPQYFAAASDARTCTACTCDAPTGVSCANVKVSAFVDSTCASAAAPATGPAGCVAAASALSAGVASGEGACAAHGGKPTGDFAPTSPSTICCTR